MDIAMILAADDKGGIGKNGTLPWHLAQDMAFFKEITTTTLSSKKKNAVVMGRKTWDSLPEKFRPLPGRENIILSHNPNFTASVPIYKSLEECITVYKSREDIETLFIIGGASIYNEAMQRELPDKIYFTKVIGDFNCDTFFTGIPGNFKLEGLGSPGEENGIIYEWQTYERISRSTFKAAILDKKVENQIQ